MLQRIFFDFQNKKQLIIAMIGALIGFTFLVTSIHYLIRINEFGKGQDILNQNILIVQKKVSNFNSMTIGKTDFGRQEIDGLRKKEFIELVQPVLNNNFGISIQTDSELVPYFRSDIFVQSLNDQFIDAKKNKWKWDENSEFVPLILSRDFLVMLNTFASAKGIPQISDDLAKTINFKFTIYNHEGKEFQNARIIGFTNEVSAILVPSSFMEYANNKYPNSKTSLTNQLMVKVDQDKFGSFEKHLKENGLEAKKSSMLVGKLKSVSSTLFSVLIAISLITVFLAGLVLIQFTQLLISKNQYEIRTLLRIGYFPSTIIKVMVKYFAKIFAFVLLTCFVLFGISKFFIDHLLLESGIEINTQFTLMSIFVLIFAFGIYIALCYRSAKQGVTKLF